MIFAPSTFRIAGPLSFTRGGMFATYVLGGQQWDFRSDSDRALLWDQATFRWASLKGRSIKLRSTPRPYPSYEFARTLDEDTHDPLPDVPQARRAGTSTWSTGSAGCSRPAWTPRWSPCRSGWGRTRGVRSKRS